MARYGLADHVYLCTDENYLVVLDVKRDRYFSLESARVGALRGEIPGWPACAVDKSEGPEPVHIDAVIESLRVQGWLSEMDGATRDATPLRLPEFTRELPAEVDLLGIRGVTGVRVIGAFFVSSLLAKARLRWRSFERVVRAVRLRKQRREAGASARVDEERLRDLVAAYHRLRVYLFTTRQECLRDSLALLGFLAHYGIYADWVFGVRARPFVAHCWVQYGGMVLNDSIEHVSGYKPIMLV